MMEMPVKFGVCGSCCSDLKMVVFRGTQKRAISHTAASIFLLIRNEKRLFLLQKTNISIG